MSTDGRGTKWRRKIAENFNRLSRAHERYRQTTDGRQHLHSERERSDNMVQWYIFVTVTRSNHNFILSCLQTHRPTPTGYTCTYMYDSQHRSHVRDFQERVAPLSSLLAVSQRTTHTDDAEDLVPAYIKIRCESENFWLDVVLNMLLRIVAIMSSFRQSYVVTSME